MTEPACDREALPVQPPPGAQLVERLKWEDDIKRFATDCLEQNEEWHAEQGRCHAAQQETP